MTSCNQKLYLLRTLYDIFAPSSPEVVDGSESVEVEVDLVREWRQCGKLPTVATLGGTDGVDNTLGDYSGDREGKTRSDYRQLKYSNSNMSQQNHVVI